MFEQSHALLDTLCSFLCFSTMSIAPRRLRRKIGESYPRVIRPIKTASFSLGFHVVILVLKLIKAIPKWGIYCYTQAFGLGILANSVSRRL